MILIENIINPAISRSHGLLQCIFSLYIHCAAKVLQAHVLSSQVRKTVGALSSDIDPIEF